MLPSNPQYVVKTRPMRDLVHYAGHFSYEQYYVNSAAGPKMAVGHYTTSLL